MKNYTFSPDEVSKPSEFHLSPDGTVLEWYDGSAKKIVVPDGVQEIAFAWYEGDNPADVIALILPDSVEILPDEMCFGMRNLEVVRMGDNVTALPTGVFLNCLKQQYIRLSENLTEIDNRAFENTYSMGYLHIPDSVTYIGGRAFRKSLLRDVTIPPHVEYVGGECFAYHVRGTIYGKQANVNYGRDEGPAPDISDEEIAELAAISWPFNLTPRYVTVLSPDMVMEGFSSFDTEGNPGTDEIGRKMYIRGLPGSTIEASHGDCPKETRPNIYYSTLNMTLCEAVARAQYKADHLRFTEDTTADDVIEMIMSAYYSPDLDAPVWKEEFTLSGNKATGILQLGSGDISFDIEIGRQTSGQPIKPGGPGTPGRPGEPGGSPKPSPGTGSAAAAGAVFLMLSAATACGFTVRRRKKKV